MQKNKQTAVEFYKTEINNLKNGNSTLSEIEYINSQCDFNYYEIRSGKCEFAKVYKGKIICEKKC